MAIAVTAYEFWGPATDNLDTISVNRTPISDLSLKSITDPNVVYYGYDIQRPLFDTPEGFVTQPMQRYIAFRITGNYTKMKNIKITIKKPSMYQKVGGEQVANATDDTKLMYKTTNQYQQPQSTLNTFGTPVGAYDPTMTPVVDEVVIRPRISNMSPARATGRQTEYLNAPNYWTEFLVLSANVFPGAHDLVGNFGKNGATDLGGITGPLVTVEIDEVGTTSVT